MRASIDIRIKDDGGGGKLQGAAAWLSACSYASKFVVGEPAGRAEWPQHRHVAIPQPA